jgi:hypothetical protein
MEISNNIQKFINNENELNLVVVNKNLYNDNNIQVKMIKNIDDEDDIKLIIEDNSPTVEQQNNKVFINIPDKNSDKIFISSDIVNIHDNNNIPNNNIENNRCSSNEGNNIISLYEENDDNNKKREAEVSSIIEKKNKLFDIIKENKKKINTSLYIISSKYDIIYFRFNKISLLILIISTIITFVEAIRLSLINYDTQYKDSKISQYISQETISLIINILSLSLSTILTILSSIVKFKNYRENMDKLKSIHDTLFNYKNLYDKQRELITFFSLSNNLTPELYEKLQETVETYNKEIKEISIFDNIRTNDIIRFNKIKVKHDIELEKLSNKRELELLKLTIENTRQKCEYEYKKNKILEDVKVKNESFKKFSELKEKKYNCFFCK